MSKMKEIILAESSASNQMTVAESSTSNQIIVAESSTSNFLPFADDFYFSALIDEEEIFPISDEKYALELHLQEALYSSSTKHQADQRPLKIEMKALRKEIGESSQSFTILMDSKPAGEMLKTLEKENGESSQSFCTICMDRKSTGEMFRNNNSCSHLFCSDCISQYVVAKIKENIASVKCPDLKCKGVLEPEICRSLIPPELFDRWENALCESLVIGFKKFYCPFKDCSALLIDDGEEVVTSSECPNCWRLFCAQCKVVWHSGISCQEFQRLREDERAREDLIVMELVQNKKWRRCPSCKFYVEKTEGCFHITCRCGFQFCYGCGSDWSSSHACPPQ